MSTSQDFNKAYYSVSGLLKKVSQYYVDLINILSSLALSFNNNLTTNVINLTISDGKTVEIPNFSRVFNKVNELYKANVLSKFLVYDFGNYKTERKNIDVLIDPSDYYKVSKVNLNINKISVTVLGDGNKELHKYIIIPFIDVDDRDSFYTDVSKITFTEKNDEVILEFIGNYDSRLSGISVGDIFEKNGYYFSVVSKVESDSVTNAGSVNKVKVLKIGLNLISSSSFLFSSSYLDEKDWRIFKLPLNSGGIYKSFYLYLDKSKSNNKFKISEFCNDDEVVSYTVDVKFNATNDSSSSDLYLSVDTSSEDIKDIIENFVPNVDNTSLKYQFLISKNIINDRTYDLVANFAKEISRVISSISLPGINEQTLRNLDNIINTFQERKNEFLDLIIKLLNSKVFVEVDVANVANIPSISSPVEGVEIECRYRSILSGTINEHITNIVKYFGDGSYKVYIPFLYGLELKIRVRLFSNGYITKYSDEINIVLDETAVSELRSIFGYVFDVFMQYLNMFDIKNYLTLLNKYNELNVLINKLGIDIGEIIKTVNQIIQYGKFNINPIGYIGGDIKSYEYKDILTDLIASIGYCENDQLKFDHFYTGGLTVNVTIFESNTSRQLSNVHLYLISISGVQGFDTTSDPISLNNVKIFTTNPNEVIDDEYNWMSNANVAFLFSLESGTYGLMVFHYPYTDIQCAVITAFNLLIGKRIPLLNIE